MRKFEEDEDKALRDEERRDAKKSYRWTKIKSRKEDYEKEK